MIGQSSLPAIAILWYYVVVLSTMIVLVVSGQEATYCNICGEGNSIQFPTGVVDFTYEGEYRKNNCQGWQRIITNNMYAISDQFCQTELLQYTYQVCRCTRPDGSAVQWVAPTPAPTTSNTNNHNAPASMVPSSGAESGIGGPTELPLEWAADATAGPSSPPAASVGVVIPTVTIGAAAYGDNQSSSADSFSLSPIPSTISTINGQESQERSSSVSCNSFAGNIISVWIFLLSILMT